MVKTHYSGDVVCGEMRRTRALAVI